MKATPLAVVIVFASCLAFAGTSPSTTVAPEVKQELAVMTTKLKLSESQQDKIRPILATEFEKKKSIQDSTSLSDKQKHDQTGAVHRAACQQIKKFFTSAQTAQIENDMNHSTTNSTSASGAVPSTVQ